MGIGLLRTRAGEKIAAGAHFKGGRLVPRARGLVIKGVTPAALRDVVEGAAQIAGEDAYTRGGLRITEHKSGGHAVTGLHAGIRAAAIAGLQRRGR